MDQVLQEFAKLNEIPRPSGHEEKVAAYLVAQGKELGIQVEIDDALNVIMEIPATNGYEDVPTVILQAHTDMVCVGNENYDPLNDAIVTEIHGNVMKAKGTSLGADDGIGVAMLLSLAKSDTPHGSLRLLFTSDEEKGMGGAKFLDTAYLDAKYLINVDWEDVKTLCIGCASCGDGEFRKPMAKKNISGQGFSLKVTGLRGGHSGCEIHENRGNAIKIMGEILFALTEEKIPFSLVDIVGGKAMNVIAPDGALSFVVAENHWQQVEDAVASASQKIKAQYGDDSNLSIDLRKTDGPEMGSMEGDSREVALFLHGFPQGVTEMSKDIEGFVSTSCNLGVISLKEEALSLVTTYRSDVAEKEVCLMERCRVLGEGLGFVIAKEVHGIPWTPKPHSHLEEIAKNAYEELGYGNVDVVSVHAGLECAYFAQKNQNLEMISIGPTVEQCHSIEERLYLDSVPKAMNWIYEILKNIKN